MNQMINFRLALTQIVVDRPSRMIQEDSWQGVVVFVDVLKGDTVKHGSNPKS